MRALVVNKERCIGCRACTSTCPLSWITLWEMDAIRHIRFPGICQEDCTRCREVCPKEVIAFEEVEQEGAGQELAFVLHRCDRCGHPFAPEKALAHLLPQGQATLRAEETPWLGLCSSCRQEVTVAGLFRGDMDTGGFV